MKYDLDHYRHAVFPLIKPWVDARPHCKVVDEIGLIAISTECPIIVVAHFVQEIYGHSESLASMIKVIKDFYRITEVKGVRNGQSAHDSTNNDTSATSNGSTSS